MTETAIIYVGTDQRSWKAELVLEHSLRKHATMPVEIRWMRASDPGVFADWKTLNNGIPYSGQGWATMFTCFRYAIPELMGFDGKAIYMDSDFVVLGDVAELWRMKTNHGWRCVSEKRTDCSLIDCRKLKQPWWPRLDDMKRSGRQGWEYRNLLFRNGVMSPTLPEEWDCLDKVPKGAKIVHYTQMRTQPWQPWPEYFGPMGKQVPRCVQAKIADTYPKAWPHHPDREAGELWWETFREALTAKFGFDEAVRQLRETTYPVDRLLGEEAC